MARFREVCKMTLRPRQWICNRDVKTERCLVGECNTCNRSYAGKGHTDALNQGQDLWVNEYCICNIASEEELLDYGNYEYIDFGDFCRKEIGIQCQCGSHYLIGLPGYEDLGKGLHYTGSGGDYHSIQIRRDSAEIFKKRMKEMEEK